jgi:thiol-disulfide isomerase/thioredoxin
MRWLVTVWAAFLVSGCAPRLYGEVDEPEPWVAPDNDWPSAAPPEDLVGTGMDAGQIALDIRGVDQFGKEVSLWQFWGHHVLLDVATVWCIPCRELAMGTEQVYQEFIEDDFIYLTVLHENNDNLAPTADDLSSWAQFPEFHPDDDHPYDLITAPIISDPFGESGSIGAVRQNQYPVALLIGPDMTVMERIEPVTEARIVEVIEETLHGGD